MQLRDYTGQLSGIKKDDDTFQGDLPMSHVRNLK